MGEINIKCSCGAEFHRTDGTSLQAECSVSNWHDRHAACASKAPCPQCARFREKIDREKMEEVFRCCDGIDVYSPEALADKMIRYLTE